jgi:diguanylate cyclase (GGDEF)-like protein
VPPVTDKTVTNKDNGAPKGTHSGCPSVIMDTLGSHTPSPVLRSLAIALGSSAGLLALVAMVAAGSGEGGLAGFACLAAMVASAASWMAWRSTQRLVADHEALAAQIETLHSSRRHFREAVAELGAVARLHDARAHSRDREGGLDEDREEILQVVAATAQRAVGAEKVVFFEFRPAPARLVARSGVGSPVGAVLDLGSGVAGAAAATRLPQRSPGEVTVVDPEPERATAMAVPFFSRNSLIGVVAVYGRIVPGAPPFGPEDLEALEVLVSQAGTAVDNVSLHDEAQRLSITDGLTGLWNRRHLELRCQEEIERAIRFTRPVGVIFCDVDRFKLINDDPEWGYPGGDAVLVEVSERLADATREIDVVARWGGEEFVLLLPETDMNGTMVLAEKVRRAVAEEPIVHGGKSRTVTISLGVASFPHSGGSVRTLLNAAGAALHRAKDGGRNRIEQADAFIKSTGTAG